MANILPVARAVILCRRFRVTAAGTDIEGVFDGVTATTFPHVEELFFAYVQLTGGYGEIPIRVELRRAADGRLINASTERSLQFPERGRIVQLTIRLQATAFDKPGVYLAELYCNNVWIGDSAFTVREEFA